jgi:hypothetical protein
MAWNTEDTKAWVTSIVPDTKRKLDVSDDAVEASSPAFKVPKL